MFADRANGIATRDIGDSNQMTTDPIAEVRLSFFAECDAQLQSLQDALARMADGRTDAGTINIVIGAVQCVESWSGAFGLTELVAFARRFGTVADAMGSEIIPAGRAQAAWLVLAADCLADMVAAARGGTSGPAGAEAILVQIEAFLPEGSLLSRDDHGSAGFESLALAFDPDDFSLADPAAGDAAAA